jgi:enoyl-CoA hydratase/isomerase-like protein
MPELVLCETRNAVAILTLNRPEKLNALNYALVDRIKERLDAIEGDSTIMVPTCDTREALDAWIARRPPRYQAR